MTVRAPGHAELVRTWPLEVLAHNEWPGLGVLPEIIGAFVLSNDPAVMAFLARARDVLVEQTGDGSMSGYQSGDRARVGAVVRAIADALGAEGISYVGVPPSFEQEGQKLRFPARILEHRQGNCLDLSCFLAAAFELAGLHPLIFMVEGHAFVGAWTTPDCFAGPAMDDASQIAKRVELGEMIVLETTLLARTPPARFDEAVRAAARRLEAPEKFQCALDLRAARKLRIRALQVGTRGGTASEDEAVALSFAPSAALLPEALQRSGAARPAVGEAARRHRRLEGKPRPHAPQPLLNFRPTKSNLGFLVPRPRTLRGSSPRRDLRSRCAADARRGGLAQPRGIGGREPARGLSARRDRGAGSTPTGTRSSLDASLTAIFRAARS
ncbi:MAG: hypothetical protein R3F20_06395 [Planctomycetota bacterium]